ncbi:MAG TPA: hypothetical protein VGE97_06530 [Nitrososphaera sp.]|jgi:hypothetical protein
MPKLTIRNIMHEERWLAPELLNNEEFLKEWAAEKFGVTLDEKLFSKDEVVEQIQDSLG